MSSVKVWGVWGSPKTIRLNNEGVIDETARLAFTRGQCHSLALAIYELVDGGWPMFGLVDPKNNKPTSSGHIVVRRPKNGGYYDIDGPGAIERWKKGGKIELHPVTREMIMDGVLEDFLPVNLKAAEPFAREVLRKYCGMAVE